MFVFFPILNTIPYEATSPILVIIGFMMMTDIKYIEWDKFEDGFPCFIIIIFIPFTYSISTGIIIGLLSYLLCKISIFIIHYINNLWN